MDKALCFCFYNEIFGVDITQVNEINRNIEFTPVTRASEIVVGLYKWQS